jgi:hypothetical protein
MSIRRPGLRTALCGAFAVAVGVPAAVVAPAHAAAAQAWTGRYALVTYASLKDGTSAATHRRESDFSAVFTLSTACAGTCVATAVGPASSNPTVPDPQRFVWDGQQWKTTYDWVWQCALGDGSQSQWSPASSFTFYTPQPDGSLRGMWHTDITAGACRGSVVMPVAALPS